MAPSSTIRSNSAHRSVATIFFAVAVRLFFLAQFAKVGYDLLDLLFI